MAIKLKTQTFQNKNLEQKLYSFILNYKKINYLISLHHNLPIYKVFNEIDIELNIIVNSCWSEVLILQTNNVDIEKYHINNKIQNKIPKINQVMYIKTNVQRYESLMIDHVFIPFDNINDDFTIPYLRARLNEKIGNLSGLSGSPVYIEDSLIGVFSKFDIEESIAYIIPIYIIIKNIIKKDNINIYILPLKNKINKINSNSVKKNMIYHKTLKINIPINTYFMLEGDLKAKFSVRYDMTNIIISHIITKPIKLLISNESYIVNKNLEYKLNPRLLNLLKNFNVNKQIIISLYNYITTSLSPVIFNIKNNKIKLLI
jgi:hypothetical protein